MNRFAILIILLGLAACGREGDPEPRNGGVGVSIGGDARIGVTGSL